MKCMLRSDGKALFKRHRRQCPYSARWMRMRLQCTWPRGWQAARHWLATLAGTVCHRQGVVPLCSATRCSCRLCPDTAALGSGGVAPPTSVACGQASQLHRQREVHMKCMLRSGGKASLCTDTYWRAADRSGLVSSRVESIAVRLPHVHHMWASICCVACCRQVCFKLKWRAYGERRGSLGLQGGGTSGAVHCSHHRGTARRASGWQATSEPMWRLS